MSGALRALVLADVHGAADMIRALTGRYDAVIVAGDITHRGTVSEAAGILNALAKIAPVYFVPGNMDPPALAGYESELVKPLHGRVQQLGPYTVGGVGGSLPTPFGTPFEIDEDEIEGTLKSLRPAPQLLVAHNPPRGCLDRVGGVVPVGSTSIRRYLEERRPLLSVHGHIHEDRGIEIIGETVIVNPGSLRDGHYAEAVLDGVRVTVQLRSV
jgi:Icc-related predicted phosphoesterase